MAISVKETGDKCEQDEIYAVDEWGCASYGIPDQIFGPVRVGDDYRSRSNRELYEFHNDMDVAKRINIQRFHWLGHVVWMDEDAVVGGHRRKGRPRTCWKDQIVEALSSSGVANKKRRAQTKGAWREADRKSIIGPHTR